MIDQQTLYSIKKKQKNHLTDILKNIVNKILNLLIARSKSSIFSGSSYTCLKVTVWNMQHI